MESKPFGLGALCAHPERVEAANRCRQLTTAALISRRVLEPELGDVMQHRDRLGARRSTCRTTLMRCLKVSDQNLCFEDPIDVEKPLDGVNTRFACPTRSRILEK
jgi:hypothetical protein